VDFRSYMTLWFWRAWLIVPLAVLAGGAAWLSRHDDPKVYEQKSSYVIRPTSRIAPDAADNVAGTLAQPDSAIVQTVLGILGSQHLPQATGPALVSSAQSPTRWTASVRPGSNIVDVRMSGHDPAVISSTTGLYSQAAIAAVNRSYTIYQLESLGADGPPVQTGPKVWLTVALAMILAVLLGSGAVAFEGVLRPGRALSRRSRIRRRGAARRTERARRARAAVQEPAASRAAAGLPRDGG
jgi:hypothetical protein